MDKLYSFLLFMFQTLISSVAAFEERSRAFEQKMDQKMEQDRRDNNTSEGPMEEDGEGPMEEDDDENEVVQDVTDPTEELDYEEERCMTPPKEPTPRAPRTTASVRVEPSSTSRHHASARPADSRSSKPPHHDDGGHHSHGGSRKSTGSGGSSRRAPPRPAPTAHDRRSAGSSHHAPVRDCHNSTECQHHVPLSPTHHAPTPVHNAAPTIVRPTTSASGQRSAPAEQHVDSRRGGYVKSRGPARGVKRGHPGR